MGDGPPESSESPESASDFSARALHHLRKGPPSTSAVSGIWSTAIRWLNRQTSSITVRVGIGVVGATTAAIPASAIHVDVNGVAAARREDVADILGITSLSSVHVIGPPVIPRACGRACGHAARPVPGSHALKETRKETHHFVKRAVAREPAARSAARRRGAATCAAGFRGCP